MQKGKLLVVDDDKPIRDTLIEIIQTFGYEVDGAEDGEKALEFIHDKKYDAVMADMTMPKMSGLELLKRIKSIDESIPVVIITGFPSIDIAIDVMKQGASDFITKPFRLEVIEHTVKRIMEARSLQLENARLYAEINQKKTIERLNTQLNEKVKELSALYKISETMNQQDNNELLFKTLVNLSSELTNAGKISFMLYDKENQELLIKTARGLSNNIVKSSIVKSGESISGKVAQRKKPICVLKSDLIEGAKVPEGFEHIKASFLSVPIIINDEMFGVLNLTDKLDSSDFSKNDEFLILTLAQKAAIKIENNALYESLYANLLDTLKSLVTIIEAKDLYTQQHSARVTAYALKFAEEMKCSEEDLEILAFAGYLHDIGKIGISDSILTKSGKLTPSEYEAIKLHPVIGDHIVEPLGLLQTEREIIKYHHERPDGKGYPEGLMGEEIPRLARIMAVADAFDAMTSTRSYRQALELDFAVEELKRYSGKMFDLEVVKAALSYINQMGNVVTRVG